MAFLFPTDIPPHEITACLAEMQIDFDAGQLTKPTYEAVRTYFEQAVISLLGVRRERIHQPEFSLLHMMEHPELHDESIPIANLFRQATKLLQICGVKDFTLNDLFKPDPARLRRQLCAIINFARFRDEKLLIVDELEAGVVERQQQEKALQAEHEKMLEELKRLQELRASRQSEVGPIDTEAAGIAAQNAQLNKTQLALHNEVRALKAQINTLTDQAAEAKLMLSSLQSDAETLQDQVVQSPEKHRQAISDVIAATEQQRGYYAALCSASHDHDRKLELMSKFERELQRCIKLQEELEGVVARKKDLSAAAKDTREAIATEERRFSELASSNATARRQLASLQDKLGRVEQQGQYKVDAAAAVLEDYVKRREAMEAGLAQGDAVAAEQELKIRNWQMRTTEVLESKDQRVRSVLEKYHMLRRGVAEYNRKLEAAISAPPPMAGASGVGAAAIMGGAGGGGNIDAGEFDNDELTQDQDTETFRAAAMAAAAAVQGMQLD
ncbi:hypothetical protein Agub_g13557 [Astrephomene gubernaculifera]|uniref:Kinetochore protein Nuf2 n=1 Tax=Astrephomene gubernaculifera TaxID=47775 RepID=A0AAD3E0G3_9CHLO|nr:hypothetical protein Agub_g13557 [Astrephomene gubernaculifera]